MNSKVFTKLTILLFKSVILLIYRSFSEGSASATNDLRVAAINAAIFYAQNCSFALFFTVRTAGNSVPAGRNTGRFCADRLLLDNIADRNIMLLEPAGTPLSEYCSYALTPI